MTPTSVPSPAVSAPVIQNLFAASRDNKKSVPTEAATLDIERHNTFWYFGLTALLFMAYGAFFFYPYLTRYLSANADLVSIEQKINDYESARLPQIEKARNEAKDQYEIELRQSESIVGQIFPGTMDKTGITERLESFASLINSKTPPFEMNRLTFDDILRQGEYTILPISTSISTSRANLDRFFKLIDLSGRFDSEYHVRLMDIERMEIRFLGVDAQTGLDRGVTVNVKLRAYSRAT